MKTCTLCKQEKSLAEFNRNKQRSDGLQNVCRDCNRSRSRKYYAENKERHRAVIKKKKTEYKELLYKELWSHFLANPCIDCGEQDPRVLEFDHVRGKERNISTMMASVCSWEKILVEIEKCEVVCANCHRKRTYKRSDSWRHRLHTGV